MYRGARREPNSTANPYFDLELTYEVLRSAAADEELQAIAGFFEQASGADEPFWVGPPGLNTIAGQAIGTGDGATTVFPLVASIGGYSGPVFGTSGVSAAYLDGVSQPSGWSVSSGYLPAITFASAPGSGVAVTADFDVLWLCRFAEDVQRLRGVYDNALGAPDAAVVDGETVTGTPPSFPALAGLGWSVHKKPVFSTLVASHVSGREVRDALYQNPIWQFELPFDGLSSSPTSYSGLGANSMQALLGFFLQMQGQFGTFLYTDPTDSAATNVTFATGDGATTTFAFSRFMGAFLEPVGWVTSVSNVFFNDVNQPIRLVAIPAQLARVRFGARRGRLDCRDLYLRFPVPVRR